MNEDCKNCQTLHDTLVIFAEKIDEQAQEIERLKKELEVLMRRTREGT